MIKKQTIIQGMLLAGLLAMMAFLGLRYTNQYVETNSPLYTSRMNPTIFVPGSSATQERFNPTFRLLDAQGWTHSILKVTVKKDGSLSTTGAISSGDQRPNIVIAFEDNTDSYENILRQAAWLNQALTSLQKKYHFRHFNAVGHSNGGLDWAFYLENYYASSNFSIGTLMTIGTPYNLEVTNLNNHTQMLQDLIDNRSTIPSDLVVYSLAGSNSYDGDYLVPITSVEAGKYIYQNQVAHFTHVTVTGSDSEHSDLPENSQVIQYILQNVLQQGQGRRR